MHADGVVLGAERVALLDLGTTDTARHVAERITRNLGNVQSIVLVDHELAMSAARGVSYDGSLNMTLEEARNLGAAIGCDYFIAGDAQTIRRSASDRPVYYEAYAALFIVNANDGHLLKWYRPRSEKPTALEAEQSLLVELDRLAPAYIDEIKRAAETYRVARLSPPSRESPGFEPAPDDEKLAAEKGIRLPQPYRRLRPEYPRSAAEADAEGTVDVLVDIDVKGEVAGLDVVRWAGFGLDEAAKQTIRQLHFRPAMIKNAPVPMRIMLRYNFRRPAKE